MNLINFRSALLVLVAGAASLVAKPRSAAGQSQLLTQVNFQQRLDNQIPIKATFVDEAGHTTTLADCIAARPTVLVLAYYRCPMLCNQVLNGVARSLRGVNFRSGADISIIVVSFDPSDTPKLAMRKKSAVVNAYRNDDDGAGWHFLTGDESTVRKLADSIGFHYIYDENTKQYAHASGIVLLTPTGRVSRYFYGIDYPTRDLRLGLVEASAGHIGTAVDELLLLCFHYDPLTGRYGLAIMQMIRGVSIAFVLGLLWYVGGSVRRELRQRRNDNMVALSAPRNIATDGA